MSYIRFDIEHLQALLDAAPTALMAITVEGHVVFSNKLAQSYFLYCEDELKGKPIDQLVPSSFRANHSDFLKRYFVEPRPRAIGVGWKSFGLRSNGVEFPIEIGLNPIHLDDLQLVIASIIDLTERNKLEQRYEIAIKGLPEGLLIVSRNGLIEMANLAAERMFGYHSDELVGMPIEVLVPARAQEQHRGHRASFNDQPSARRMGIGTDLYGKCKDGSELPVEIGLNPIGSGDDTEIIVTIIDISSRRKLEQERHEFESKIQHTQKLDSLGVLAGGIAHDFNNILTGVLGNAELALMSLPTKGVAARYLAQIMKAAESAAELCNQMLAYTGKNLFSRKPLALNEVIESTSELVQASVSKRALMKFSLMKDLPNIVGDASQIRQVIMNLVINASEAIGDKSGLITLATGITDYSPAHPNGFSPYMTDLQAGRYIYLAVSDNGQGIDPAIMGKIFDPFFSTRFTGRGLGLAAVLGIIRSHGGSIRINSELGKGTTFRVLLPFEGIETEAGQPLADDSCSFTASGNVLIIDDEEVVHQVFGDTLKRTGLNVLSARSGREGLEVLEASNNGIVLVILDLMMPFMTGDEVYRRLRQINAFVPVMITSGYSEEEVSSQFDGCGIAGFMHKPVSPSRLLKLVREVVDI